MCTARGTGGGVRGARRGAGREVYPDPAPPTLSFLVARQKKGLPAAPVYHSSRGEWAGEEGARSNR